MPRALKLDKAGKLKLSEDDVVRQVCDFLEAHGWQIYRRGYGAVLNEEGVQVGTVGEVGESDYEAIRFKSGVYAEVMFLEFKRPKCKGDSGGRLRKEQRDWITLQRLRGATCLVVDDLLQFREFYRKEIGSR